MRPLWFIYPSNVAPTRTLSSEDRLILVHVAKRAPPKRQRVPPPSANSAENHPVFKQMLFGSTWTAATVSLPVDWRSSVSPSCRTRKDWNKLMFSDREDVVATVVVVAASVSMERFFTPLTFLQ